MASPKPIDRLLEELQRAVGRYDAKAAEATWREIEHRLRDDPTGNPEAFRAALSHAVDSFDRPRVEKLCNRLTAHLLSGADAYPAELSRKLLGGLRRKRYFEPMIQVAEAMIQTGETDPKVRRLYGQALIDHGQLSAALSVLEQLATDCEKAKAEKELAEATGLIGRTHKQIYMNAAAAGSPPKKRAQSLDEAIAYYRRIYSQDTSNIWNGINVVALAKRAQRDRIRLTTKLEPDAIARSILKSIERKDEGAKKDAGSEPVNMWECATAAEACLALRSYGKALEWTVRYTQGEYADAFEFASTLRQFEEVWQLDAGHKQEGRILQLLRSALLRKEGARVEIEQLGKHESALVTALASDAKFEQVLGQDRYRTFQWYAMGLQRASGVAKIVTRTGTGQGTGFLVRGSDLHPSIADPWVMMTNAHVISEDEAEWRGTPAALPPDEVRVTFETGDNAGQEIEIKEVIFSSGRNELDCTIATLASPVTLDNPYPISRRLPITGKNQRVYVIGHPKGSGLSFSLDDNLLLDHEAPRVHYRAPTEGGSSGSPVFNAKWDLIALHHMGGMSMPRLRNQGGTYPANEGIALQNIRAALAKALE